MTLNLTSGDLIADRRAEYAHMLAESGAHAQAADLMAQALELAPDWAAGWFRLAGYEEASGRTPAAIAALRRVLDLSPQDRFGAGLKLAILGATETPQGPPSAYVGQLFDDYADRFDAALVDRLDYSVPEKLATLVAGATGNRRFGTVVDLGCGTGLFGARIRDRTDRLEGYDLSANMLARAAEKGVYDHLAQADLSLAPKACGLFSGFGEGRADLASAADVLMYLGRLEGVFSLVLRLLSAEGCFAFSVEEAGDQDIVLRPSMRFAHGKTYITRLCADFGLSIVDLSHTVLRKDGGNPVDGILFVARRTG